MSRVLKPAAVKAGLGEWVRDEHGHLRAESWVGHHTFRHTCATGLFRAGWNAVQVQRWLGHHKPSFTIDTYVHLLEQDIPEPIAVAGGNAVATRPPETSRDGGQAEEAETRIAPSPVSAALEAAASSYRLVPGSSRGGPTRKIPADTGFLWCSKWSTS
jgi:hypothetical protein